MCVVVPFNCLVIHYPLRNAPVLPLFTQNRWGITAHLIFLTGGMAKEHPTLLELIPYIASIFVQCSTNASLISY